MSRNIVDQIAWWIPIRSLRDKFRKKLIDRLVKDVIKYLPIDDNEPINLPDEWYHYPDAPIQNKDIFKILNNSFGEDKSKVKVLEIGSRVLGEDTRNGRIYFPDMDYTGFDYHAGPNVDVVGDAHKLSSYFKEDEKFDIVVSVAVFEHLAMPWKVAEEIFKVLKPGGYVYICTHFAWALHERPWHFFHFTDMGLKVLFNETLGFKCLESGFTDLLVVKFSKFTYERVRNKPFPGLYGGVQYFGQKIKDKLDYDWNAMTVDKVLPNTEYPTPIYDK